MEELKIDWDSFPDSDQIGQSTRSAIESSVNTLSQKTAEAQKKLEISFAAKLLDLENKMKAKNKQSEEEEEEADSSVFSSSSDSRKRSRESKEEGEEDERWLVKCQRLDPQGAEALKTHIVAADALESEGNISYRSVRKDIALKPLTLKETGQSSAGTKFMVPHLASFAKIIKQTFESSAYGGASEQSQWLNKLAELGATTVLVHNAFTLKNKNADAMLKALVEEYCSFEAKLQLEITLKQKKNDDRLFTGFETEGFALALHIARCFAGLASLSLTNIQIESFTKKFLSPASPTPVKKTSSETKTKYTKAEKEAYNLKMKTEREARAKAKAELEAAHAAALAASRASSTPARSQ